MYNVIIPQSLLLYCFKADSYYDYNRRVWLLSVYIKRRFGEEIHWALIRAICKHSTGGNDE